MSAVDWSKIWKKYRGLWVVLKSDEKTVIASGKTAKEALKKAEEKGEKNPIITKMPPKLIGYVGFGL